MKEQTLTQSYPETTPAFIDIEASGFGAHSFPVEVGLALPDGSRYCALIRPNPAWTHWNKQAERIHGLTRELLMDKGRDAREVCSELNDLLAGTTVFSDGWVVDFPWLRTLFSAGQAAMRFRVSALEMILSEAQLGRWDAVKEELFNSCNGTRHRASQDAGVIQQAYRIVQCG